MKNTHVFYALVRLEVETDLDKDRTADELSNIDYDFKSTDTVKVVDTQWAETYPDRESIG
jgi:hypothetical protein